MKNDNLAVLWYVNGVTGYVYKTDEPLRIVTTPGFFDPISNLSGLGDQIYVVAGDGVKMFYIEKLTPHVQIKEL